MNSNVNEGHRISLAEAAVMTKRFRETLPDSGATIGHYFGSPAIREIMNQAGCIGIRIYYGINLEGEKQLVVVGVDADGNDLYQGMLADRSILCPSFCSTDNPLNSDAK